MTTFLRVLADENKQKSLSAACAKFRLGNPVSYVFEIEPEVFRSVPGAPFTYWVTESILQVFQQIPPFESDGRTARVGLQTSDNFRFVRSWWEISNNSATWRPLSKGSNRVPFYCEMTLVMNWKNDGAEMKSWAGALYNNSHWSRIMMNHSLYFLPGITFPRRPHLRGWFQFLPAGALFSTDSPIIVGRELEMLKVDASILNSSIFSALLGLLMPRGSSGGQTLKYETGYVSSVPIPVMHARAAQELRMLADRGFQISRALESLDECSRYFSLPLF
jgi:hypothetical protein